jgi:hypothetical protein
VCISRIELRIEAHHRSHNSITSPTSSVVGAILDALSIYIVQIGLHKYPRVAHLHHYYAHLDKSVLTLRSCLNPGCKIRYGELAADAFEEHW